MEQPLHSIRNTQDSFLSPKRLPALIASTALVLISGWALSAGLAQRLIEKLPDEIKVEIKEKVEKKEPPPPPPEMKAPPPPFVPPPDIVIQTEAPPPTNTITAVQNKVQTAAPPISSPASIGKKHECGRDYYPPISVRLNEQGVTTVGFTITADGNVENVHIVNSSGSDRLDNAAITCASAWHYKPAVQEGKPVSVPWKTVVQWKLQ